MKIRLSGIVKESIVDGPGIRYVIFVQGCQHNCFHCHNPHTHDIQGGYMMDIDELAHDINNHPYIAGVTLSGGEPFLQVKACSTLLSKIHVNKNIIAYTGFTYEYLIQSSKYNKNLFQLLNQIDYLIDGKFEYLLRNLTLKYRGSSNQRMIDLKESISSGQVIQINL
jgi:anaerobic ribonucleoside-triphosphate reductase activating protein